MNIRENIINELKTKIAELDSQINKEELNRILELKSQVQTLTNKSRRKNKR